MFIDRDGEVDARNIRFEPPRHFAVLHKCRAFAGLLRRSGAVAIGVDPISGDLAAATLEMGRIVALTCGVCHRLGKDEPGADAGPRIWGIVGRPIASRRFPCSDALLAETGSWTFARLNAFLAGPAGTEPGTGMWRGYLAEGTDRINMIADFGTLADDPVPLPQVIGP